MTGRDLIDKVSEKMYVDMLNLKVNKKFVYTKEQVQKHIELRFGIKLHELDNTPIDFIRRSFL